MKIIMLGLEKMKINMTGARKKWKLIRGGLEIEIIMPVARNNEN